MGPTAAADRRLRPIGTIRTVTITDERRLVTVLFADLVGFTGRAETSDPEQVRELQRAYFAVVAQEVERYGGVVEKYIGDAAMALFGVPQAHDDDAERALRTALAIRDGVTALDDELEVRIGVNTGEVVGGPGGPQGQGDYSVSGDAVNVSARLQQSAQPNEILAGGMTRRLAYEAFDFAPRDAMQLKGRAETVEAWSVQSPLPDGARLRGGEARLVGRDRELALLTSALEEARDGRGLMLALAGEPGIGKSRLAVEVVRRAEGLGFTTAWTASRSYASVFPYHLVGQLVPRLLGQRTDGEPITADVLRGADADADDATLHTWASVLDDVLGTAHEPAPELEELSPAGRQRILVQSIGALLRARSATGPMLIVLDDLHWADPASLSVIEELLTILPELPVALLATYRSHWSHGWEGRSAYEQVNLRPLRQEDARRLAQELSTGSRMGDEVTEQVLERSGGNPLFLEELVHGERAVERGGTRRLPASIHEMLLARLDALPADARRVLQLASVVGMEFSEPLVAGIAETDAGDVEEHLRMLQRAELIQSAGSGADRSFLFRHPLIHEVAYGSLVTSTRRTLHGRVGRWLEAHGGEDRVAELARHYEHSDDRQRALRYLRLAGERAHSLNATREAFDWFSAAAGAAEEPSVRAELLEAAAQEIYLLGDTKRASDIQRQAIEIHASGGNERGAANARTWLGRYIWLLGDPVEAQRQIDLAVEGLEGSGPSPELALAYSFRAQSLMLIPDFDAGELWARKAIEVAEATGATFALIHATNNLGTCLIGRSDARGIEHLRRSRDLAMEHHLPDEVGRANNNASGQGARISPMPYRDMDDLLREATAYSHRTIPDGIFDRWIRVAYGEFLFISGRWEEAETVLGGIDAAAAEAYLGGEVLSLRGQMLAYRGRFEEADVLTAGVPDTARQVGDLQAVLPALMTHAAIRFGLDDEPGALAALRDAVERRGDLPDGILSAWFAFEAADELSTLFLRRPSSPALPEGLEIVASLCRVAAADVLAGGDLAQVATRHALFGAATEQLASLGRRTGTRIELPAGSAMGRKDAVAVLDGEHRLFDAARVRLWLAEDGGDSALADAAARTFEELGAAPYRARAGRIGRSA